MIVWRVTRFFRECF